MFFSWSRLISTIMILSHLRIVSSNKTLIFMVHKELFAPVSSGFLQWLFYFQFFTPSSPFHTAEEVLMARVEESGLSLFQGVNSVLGILAIAKSQNLIL